LRKRYLLFLILPFFLSFCADVRSDYSRIKIVEVVDGDTLLLDNGRYLRLIGIDTPEIRKKTSQGFVYDPAPFSLEAKMFAEELAQGKICRVEFDIEAQDKYKRLLGYCFIKEGDEEIFLNSELLKEGYAVLYTYPPNTKHVKEFIKAQREAREKGQGLWGGYEVIRPDQADSFAGQIRSVRGEVLSTYNSGKVVFLNFGHDHKTDFTAAIFKNSFKYFADKGIVPEVFYKGKVVEVTGRIREYNGPEIIVNIPQEIEVIEECQECVN
jgi:endonuclease YncB( thermonuclease family)